MLPYVVSATHRRQDSYLAIVRQYCLQQLFASDVLALEKNIHMQPYLSSLCQNAITQAGINLPEFTERLSDSFRRLAETNLSLTTCKVSQKSGDVESSHCRNPPAKEVLPPAQARDVRRTRDDLLVPPDRLPSTRVLPPTSRPGTQRSLPGFRRPQKVPQLQVSSTQQAAGYLLYVLFAIRPSQEFVQEST